MINMDLKEWRERILIGIRITSINGIRIPLKSTNLFSINKQNKNAEKKWKTQDTNTQSPFHCE